MAAVKPRFDSVSPPLSEYTQRLLGIVNAEIQRRADRMVSDLMYERDKYARMLADHRRRQTWRWKLRHIIVQAAPTCRLWRRNWCGDWLEFSLWPSWKITDIELVEHGRS